MARLQQVLGRKSDYLARALEVHSGIESSVARRFVQVAGADLIESYLWQRAEIEGRELADPSNARDLLSGAYTARIAHELGIPRKQVWVALRAFVPRVLQLAGAAAREVGAPPSMGFALRWSRPMTAQTPALLRPMD
jgi:hypothetical protein